MKYSKPPVTIPDQIEKLKQRGLSIPDDELALRFLSNISYYRLRAYKYPLQNNADSEHPFVGQVK